MWHGEGDEVMAWVNITEVFKAAEFLFHAVRFVHCEMNYKLIVQHQQMHCSVYCIFYY